MKKSLSEIRTSKPFYPFDLIIYCILAVIVAGVFFIVFLTEKTGGEKGFKIIYDDKVAAEYYYKDGNLIIRDGFSAYFYESADGIYFYPDGELHDDYNLIAVDRENKTVTIKETTCAGRDCAAMVITADGGFIYCAPHKLKIIPAGLNDPVSG